MVPTSTKPKPSRSNASGTCAFLSKPAARPTGFGNLRPKALTASSSLSAGALATGGQTPSSKQFEAPVFEDSVSKTPNDVKCDKALPADVYLSAEMSGTMADPQQDPRGAPDFDPLWTILDTTPEGRGTDWYPKLAY